MENNEDLVSDYQIIYECQWLQEKKSNPDVIAFIKTFDLPKRTRLIPRVIYI